MQNYLVEVTTTTTTTYSVPAADEIEARQRYPEKGVPIHSDASLSEPTVVGVE